MAVNIVRNAPGGFGRRTPPALFPAIMGLFGLGLAWRGAAARLALPEALGAGLGEALLGAVTLLFAAALVAYLAKLVRRPAALVEELRTLPGRAGLSALVLSTYLLAMTLGPYLPGLGLAIFRTGLAAHLGLILLIIYVFATGPAEQRRVTPVWHLNFSGFVVAALAAQALQLPDLALALMGLSALAATLIWSISVDQALRTAVPAPLRPLLAIHLAPAALLGLVAAGFDLLTVATGCAALTAALLAAGLLRIRWLLAQGFSAFWGALTFPLAATAALWLVLGGAWALPGTLLLVAATLIIPIIAGRILRLWARGDLAARTAAVTA